jgi:beta-ureidopropionase / N-carbamoyl-L-amino-acid hydrolase
MSAPTPSKDLAIDRARFERILRELACIGADPCGGVTRLGLSTAESEARAYLSDVSRGAGLVPEIDPAGNLLIRRPSADPRAPVLLLGSHLDSVRQGGWLDGAYGVVAALEVLTVLVQQAVDCRLEPVAVGFANEEGALVQYPFWGSRALAGELVGADDARDRDGRSARSYLLAAGGDPVRLAKAAWRPGSIAGYLELHIEQGVVLEQRQIPIGAVDSIVGRTIFEIEVHGEAGHPGTTPMTGRKDALTAAAQLVLKVESIAAELCMCSSAMVGFLHVAPNTTNTIPGAVRLTAEIRDTNRDRIRSSGAVLESMAAKVARDRGIEIVVRKASQSDPVATDPAIRSAVEQAARSLSLECLAMPSGAGHDAQIVAAIAPAGMIFVPSKDGISHTAAEDTAPDALVSGADVLLHSVLLLRHGLYATPAGPGLPLPNGAGRRSVAEQADVGSGGGQLAHAARSGRSP